MSEQQQHSNLPTYQRASAPSPFEPGSRFPSEIPEAAKQTTPERQSVELRYGDGIATLKEEMRGTLTDAIEVNGIFNDIMDE
ncbi:hypothetical protein IFR04_016088 [Cadophora malorum]|uniref:Uncharacterized protein n=1 Tax=Cadophora malorum TaxID=108018 RepID=A0A8H7T1W6_9HELO|nr:hypothetical protein IFR04_016088 [Cadophora malorum]